MSHATSVPAADIIVPSAYPPLLFTLNTRSICLLTWVIQTMELVDVILEKSKCFNLNVGQLLCN